MELARFLDPVDIRDRHVLDDRVALVFRPRSLNAVGIRDANAVGLVRRIIQVVFAERILDASIHLDKTGTLQFAMLGRKLEVLPFKSDPFEGELRQGIRSLR